MSIFLEYDSAVSKIMSYFTVDPKIRDPLEKAIELGVALVLKVDETSLKNLDKEDQETLEPTHKMYLIVKLTKQILNQWHV